MTTRTERILGLVCAALTLWVFLLTVKIGTMQENTFERDKQFRSFQVETRRLVEAAHD